MRPTWDESFFALCDVIARRSKDPSTQVGCVIIGPNKEVRAMGYNGLARGVDDTRSERFERPQKYLWMAHSEENALISAARMGTSIDGCTAYCQYYPCARCARMLIQAGIVRVCVRDGVISERWQEDYEVAKQMFEEAGVVVQTPPKFVCSGTAICGAVCSHGTEHTKSHACSFTSAPPGSVCHHNQCIEVEEKGS
jgi:dCMP deaminase